MIKKWHSAQPHKITIELKIGQEIALLSKLMRCSNKDFAMIGCFRLIRVTYMHM